MILYNRRNILKFCIIIWKIKWFYIITFTFFMLQLQQNICLKIENEQSCNRSRQLMTELWGEITDGTGDYPKESHCEWLIRAPTSDHSIVLNITSMDTECSYDHLYVYDGETYNSSLLSVFSGKTSPSVVVADSGMMLILLYSDTNYIRSGFYAQYHITECPFNCSGRGKCLDYTCLCDDEYYGIGCEKEYCPDDCGYSNKRGKCIAKSCLCREGYSGESCSLQAGSLAGDKWHWINKNGEVLQPRTSHSTVYIPSLDKMFIFGGYNLNEVLDDLVVYSFKNGTWLNLKERNGVNSMRHRRMFSDQRIQQLNLRMFYNPSSDKWQNNRNEKTFLPNYFDADNVIVKETSRRPRRMIRPSEERKTLKRVTSDVWPQARFGHCFERFHSHFVIYGGKLEGGNVSSELWLFNTTTDEWSLVGVGKKNESDNESPPPLMYCSLTLVDDEWLYLFGGSSINGQFSNAMFRISPLRGWIWQQMNSKGGNSLKARVVGHSTVFHAGMRSLYIYAGIKVNIARFSKLSDQLLVYNVDKNFWTEIHYRKDPAPLERAFHSALIAGNYMVIYGGYMHKHKEEETCYDNKIYLFHLRCHVWLSPKLLPSQGIGSEVNGVYGHGAFLRHQNTIVISCGFHGSVTNHVMAYILPSTIIAAEGSPFNEDEACRKHPSQSSCVSNLGCGWCSSDKTCYDRSKSVNCTTNLQTSQCPEICPTLLTCQACVMQGNICGWCIRSRSCKTLSSAVDQRICGIHHSQGWWGERDNLLLSQEDCITRDIPPGLTYLQYRSPPNYSQPDSVSIINDIGKDLRRIGDPREPQELQAGSMNEYRLKGFLHPLYMQHVSGNKVYQGMELIRLFIEGYKLNASLWISSDESEENLQKVAFIVNGKKQQSEATQNNGNPLMFSLSKRHLFQMDIIPLPIGTNNSFNLSVSWSLGSSKSDPLSVQQLEPYSKGGTFCSNYSSCLACLSDSLCEWCSLSKKCIPRNFSNCLLDTFPVIDTSECEQCEDFIYCNDCIKSGYCEWLPEKGHCTRKGRYSKAIRELDECPIPCHQRQTCNSCLGEPGLCAWCKATEECFLFSLFTSLYQYGACRVWIDEDHANITAIEESTSLHDFSLADNKECLVCERFLSCQECLKSLGCGWCYNKFNPTVGRCTTGDYSSPHKGTCDVLMKEVMYVAEKNISVVFNSKRRETDWTYASCPDIDECLLQLDDCHSNATCVNTHQSYNCTCPRGFTGNGKTNCEKTCYENCVHGICSGPPNFVCGCDLGWTGDDCSVNCGCNNHSKCEEVGVCENCQEETTGDSCQFCRPGSYGNATTIGCKRCDCNDHWDESKGKCDQTSGMCYCVHNTQGHNCNTCMPGFYGDPRNNGKCYRKCTARGIIINATEGYFGSQTVGEDASDTCLWILSAHPTINPSPASLQGSHILQVTIEDIEIDCQAGALYIYEGMPDFVSVRQTWDKQNLIGTYCKDHTPIPITAEAQSGVMTVFYEKRSTGQGFRASYQVLYCPNNFGKNRHCHLGKPICNEGYRGSKCDVSVCPNRCFEIEGRGRCDSTYGRCVCSPGYVGEDCSIDRKGHLVVLQELFNPLKISSSLSHLQTVLPRFGHSLVVDHKGSLWAFGGYSLSRGPLNDIQQFDTRNKTWVQVTVNVHPGAQPPSQRYLHASAYVINVNEMFVYGGMNKTNFLNDFWKFNIASESWALLPNMEDLPGLSGHTLTCKGEQSPQSLLLIGGVSEESGMLDNVWEFDLLRFSWQKVLTAGSKPIGIFGHSTVYHELTKSFYIYGGYVYRNDSIQINELLYTLDYTNKKWSVLPPDGKINHNPASRPAPRAFHSAVTTAEYMVLIGGIIYDRLNSNQDLIVYSYKCNMWIPLNNHFITVAGYEFSAPMLGVSAAIYKSSIYVFGGFSGSVHGSIIEITIPEDLCTLNANKTQCRDVIGCANCVVYDNLGMNTSYCYSNTKTEPPSCLRPHGKLTSIKGINCDAALLEDRECYQYKSCIECLAYWPAQRKAKQNCQWCLNCPEGKCIPKQANCLDEISCHSHFHTDIDKVDHQAVDINKCPELICASSDCEKCMELGHCSWMATRTCRRKSNHSNPDVEWIYQNSCPRRCYLYRTCKSCLQSDDGESGLSSCFWSPTLRKCLSHTSLPLQCLGGMCGHILKDRDQCPPPCTSYTQCTQCLKQAQCGWCAIDTSIGGLGICSEGRMDGPWKGRCRDLHYENLSKNQTLIALHRLNADSFLTEIKNGLLNIQWHYGNCPPENECENRHHKCSVVKEMCEDIEEGYFCKCASGYNKSSDGTCKPACQQGCEYGTCIKPNNCSCNFGYVGISCSIKCQCNGHSECAGINKLTTCLKCHNNTAGAQCQRCESSYVGNPEKNQRCKSCQEYCFGHTDLCASSEAVNLNISLNVESINIMNSKLEGPLTDAVCLQCKNKTEGKRCKVCLPGYFRGTTNLSVACKPCHCNGHGSVCDPDWGTNCDCKNNTETPSPCNPRTRGGIPGKEKDKDCWRKQCSKCKENYFGNPVKGHQCYRQMTLENEFCLDPYTQNECHSSPSPLPRGKAIFFAVQPKFNNVDIRLFIDISSGGVDAYFTTFQTGFIVKVNFSSGHHNVKIDSAYPAVENKILYNISPQGAKLLPPRYDLVGTSSYIHKYSIERNFTRALPLVSQYLIHNIKANGLKTYFTLYDSNHFLVVKNITDRLVVTLPKQNHNLSEAKFYVVLFGLGSESNVDSYGAIYFRQDQPRIDLFVFFSVFFSCFFLFLAVCVVVWKIKQGVDERRARRQIVVEMLHMAKRPFSSATVVLNAEDTSSSQPPDSLDQMVWSPARRKRGQKKERTIDRFEIGPMAVEPTDDGVAAVVTIVVQMPGVCIGRGNNGQNGPSQRMALGSALCLVSRIYPPSSRPFHLRRRTSHLST